MNDANRGKLVILFIFGLSAVMGGYAWWHHFTQGRRCLELWGGEAGELIRYAPVVEAIKLGDPSEEAAVAVQISGSRVPVGRSVDISNTPGLVHARQALIEDASFRWDSNIPTTPVEWTYGLRFVDGQQRVTLAFDRVAARVCHVESGKVGQLTERLRDVYQQRIPSWIERAAK